MRSTRATTPTRAACSGISVFRDEVLALNAEHHADELRLDVAAGMKRKGEEDEEGGLVDN